jgi:UDP:flavonoid glycosyltransferase YjiC (YdhE family)
MRVLFTSHPGLGHTNGLVALGLELAAQGHQVLAAGAPSVARAFHAARLPAISIVPEPTWSDSARARSDVPAIAAAQPENRLAVVHAELGIRERALNLLPALDPLVRGWRPSLMLRDATEFAAWMIADRYDLPQVSLEVSTHWPEARWDAEVGDALRDLRTMAGRPGSPDRPSAGMYSHLHLNNAPAALRDPDVELPANRQDLFPTFFEGRASDAEVIAPPGHIYVAFGSVYQPPDGLVHQVVTELARLAPVVLASTQTFAHPGVVSRPFVPQTPCMPRCSLVLCHGGRSTVLTALAQGVPVVCAPLGSDHFDVARLAARAGAGLVSEWQLDALVDAVRRVWTEPHYADGARNVARQIAVMPKPAAVVDLLAQRFG